MDYFDITIITSTIPERETLLAEAVNSVNQQRVKAKNHLIEVDTNRIGPSAVRNKLAKMADTEWIAFLDDDDILYQNHIEEYSKSHHHSDMMYTWCDSVGRENFNPNSHFDADRLMHGNYIPITAAVRTSLFLQVGGFSEDSRYEDWDLWKKLLQAGARFTCIPTKTWCYRFLGNNRTYVG